MSTEAGTSWRSHGPVWQALRRAGRPLARLDLVEAAGLSQGEVMQHLAHLSAVGLVTRTEAVRERRRYVRYLYAVAEVTGRQG